MPAVLMGCIWRKVASWQVSSFLPAVVSSETAMARASGNMTRTGVR